MDLSYKSTGAIYDELYTASMKLQVNPSHENISRFILLSELATERSQEISFDAMLQLNDLLAKLEVQLKNCWDAQEAVMRYQRTGLENLNSSELYLLGQAAITAQVTNAARCKLVRQIDEFLGESNRTYLEKTYA